MTTYTVPPNVSGVTLNAGDLMNIDSGGVATSTKVNSGGTENVNSGGTASGTIVNSGGTENVFSGGIASGTKVNFDAIENISAGGTAISATVDGTEKVFSGGTTISSTLNLGNELVFSGGATVGTLVMGVGEEGVGNGGVARSTTVEGGGVMDVASGGAASGTTIVGAGYVSVEGTTVSTILNGGFEQVLSGGVVSSTKVNSGGNESISGRSVNTVVNGGGTEYVFSGGVARGTVVNSGGTENVLSGGVASGTFVDTGGTENVYSGGVTSGTTVNGVGIENVSGGSANGTTVNVGGVEAVFGGGVARGTAVGGGALDVYSGGVATDTMLNAGGEGVYSGGVVSGTTVNVFGVEYVFSGGVASGTVVNSRGVEVVYSGGTAGGTVLNQAGTIDVAYVAFSSGMTASVNASDVLTLTSGGHTVYTQQLAGTYTGYTFSVTSGSEGTDITAVACYLAGTLIATEHGETPVEDLAIGDLVLTHDGGLKPIKWIGERSYAGLFAAVNPKVQPVLVRRGALGAGLPRRDLYLSPEHALLLQGVLIPAGKIVNGASIVVAEGIDPIRYFHIELEGHDVLLAEGVAAESYVECDNRGMFQNALTFATLYPGDCRPSWEFCAPRVEEGFVLDLVRQDLASIAGIGEPEWPQAGPLKGCLDVATRDRVTGWAFQPDHPESPVLLEILDGDALLVRVRATKDRPDVAAAGFGDGRSGFDVRLPRPLCSAERHEIHVRRAVDKAPLRGSPRLVPAAVDGPAARAALKEAVAIGLSSAAGAADLDALLVELDHEVERVRQWRSRMLKDAVEVQRHRQPRALVIDDL